MQITVDIILGGKRITLDVASTDNISSVKAKIKETEGIPIEQQYLYYDSRLLLDTDILEHCGVKNDDTLRLVNLEGLEQDDDDEDYDDDDDNDHGRQDPFTGVLLMSASVPRRRRRRSRRSRPRRQDDVIIVYPPMPRPPP